MSEYISECVLWMTPKPLGGRTVGCKTKSYFMEKRIDKARAVEKALTPTVFRSLGLGPNMPLAGEIEVWGATASRNFPARIASCASRSTAGFARSRFGMKIHRNFQKVTISSYGTAHTACTWGCWNILKVGANCELRILTHYAL
jgi:hypothetical protein